MNSGFLLTYICTCDNYSFLIPFILLEIFFGKKIIILKTDDVDHLTNPITAVVTSFSFQILQHFAVVAPIGQVYIQLLLDMLHKSQVQIFYSLLPKTVETLLSVPQPLREGVKIIPVHRDVPPPVVRRRRTAKENDDEPLPDEEDEAEPRKKEVGEILYYGVEKGIDGTSAGLMQKDMYLKDLRLIDKASPSLLTKPFKSLIHSTASSTTLLCSSSPSGNTDQEEERVEPYVCAFVDLFADGFSPYKNCSRNYWIVSCIVSLIGNSKKKFHTKCKNFIPR